MLKTNHTSLAFVSKNQLYLAMISILCKKVWLHYPEGQKKNTLRTCTVFKFKVITEYMWALLKAQRT